VEVNNLLCKKIMQTELTYICKKRNMKIEANNLCDWFEKRRTTLKRHNCRNCRFFENEEKNKSKNSKKDISSEKKEKKTKKRKKE